MNTKYDIISIGDCTIDTFLLIHDIQIKHIDGQQKAIINWGDKLPVDKFYRTVAGNATNNAVGSARLGLKTAFYTVLAHDVGGREILHKMRKEKVSTDYIVIDDRHGTNASTVLSFEGERTIFVYHEHRQYKLPKLAPSKWVYLTSMGLGFEKIYKDLATYLDNTKAGLTFNPGTFQLRAGIKKNQEILKRTTLLSVNVEEAQSWVGDCNRDIEELCRKLLKLGPKAVVVTDGKRGAFSLSDEGFFYVSEYPGPRIEATGAGDGFTTAYTAGLLYGKRHKEALLWGPVNAASVVLKVGPIAGLLSRGQIESHIHKKKSYKVVEVKDLKTKERIVKYLEKMKD